MVLFGGAYFDGAWQELGDTWEYDGTTWTQRFPTSSPSPREAPSMAYDSNRQVVVLFGGWKNGYSEYDQETWEWNGNDWTLVSNTGPTARYGHNMAYDSARGVTVLFGGSTAGAGIDGKTWEWDGLDWTMVSESDPNGVLAPSPRYFHAMAYDVERAVNYSLRWRPRNSLGRYLGMERG